MERTRNESVCHALVNFVKDCERYRRYLFEIRCRRPSQRRRMIVQHDDIDTSPLSGSQQLIEIIAFGIDPIYASSRN